MWDNWKLPNDRTRNPAICNRIEAIVKRLWFHHFKYDLDTLSQFKHAYSREGDYEILKKTFFSCEWFAVYDFIEFLIQDSDTFLDTEVLKQLNAVLEKEKAAYRIVGKEVVEITDRNEIKAIEDALSHPDAPVREHIRAALVMLSDRENPDYRNSIKESISAVEATCRLVTNLKTATLGDALKKIPDLHPALQKSFLALYGFTSDASGVRHSLLEESNLTYADAKFMLASCSVFVSYLRSNMS